ncbi:MAG: hypothetical protein ABMA64_10915 [Myxococcota bacterium]
MVALVSVASLAAGLTPQPLPGDQRALVEVTAEPHLVVAAGYERGVSVGGREVGLAATVALPVFLLDGAHQRWELSGRAAVLRWRGLGVGVRLSAAAQTTASDVFRGVALGVGGVATPGLYGERGFAAAELGLGLTPVTWISPTDRYAREVWDAPSGFYAGTGTAATLGVCGGLTFGRIGLGARLGVDGTLAGGHRTAPVFAGVGAHVSL